MGTKYYIRNRTGGYVSSLGGDPRLFDSIKQAESYVSRKENQYLYICEYSTNILHLDCIEQLEDIGFRFTVQGSSVYVTLDSLMVGPIMDNLKWLTDGEHFFNRDFGVKAKFTFHKTISTIEEEILEYTWEIIE